MRYAAIGIKGRKNCLVIGKTWEVRRRVAMAVLTRGPGVSMIDREKIPTTASNSHWKS